MARAVPDKFVVPEGGQLNVAISCDYAPHDLGMVARLARRVGQIDRDRRRTHGWETFVRSPYFANLDETARQVARFAREEGYSG